VSGPETARSIADALVGARRSGQGLTGFPGAAPADMTAAYAIQDAAIAQWSDTLALGAQGPGKPGQYAVEAIAVGARRTLTGSRLPGSIVTNIVYTKRFADVDVSMGVYNLFNHRAADPASYEIREASIRQDGRTYRLKLTYAF
jgi:outer membrane receptor protein involved in Fe transport